MRKSYLSCQAEAFQSGLLELGLAKEVIRYRHTGCCIKSDI